MRLDGREEVSPVVFREEGAQPLLGAVTLEIFSLGIDPGNGRLIPVDAFMLEAEPGRRKKRGSSCMKPDNDRKRKQERDDAAGLTPSVAELQRLIGPSPGYRMLTPYEIELLRRSKREISEVVGNLLVPASLKPPRENL